MGNIDKQDMDEILGIVRCARCGQRLDGDIECPFCGVFFADAKRAKKKHANGFLKWVYITACFLTSPISLYFIIRNKSLSPVEKMIAFSGCIIWALVYYLSRKFNILAL